MCGPMAIAAGLTLVSGIASGLGAYQQTQAQAAGYETQARLNDRQAQIEADKGAFEANRETEKARRLAGAQVANYAASGIQIDGSAGRIIEDSAAEASLDVGAVRYGAELRSSNEMFKGQVNRMNANSARSAGPLAFITPIIKGASSINFGGFE